MIRTIAAVLILSVCASAWAQEILTPQGDWLPALPSRIATADAVICPVTLDAALAVGYRLPTDADYAAREAANAEAAAQAAAQANLPAVFPNGVAVVDENGHHIELLPTGDGLPVIGAQVSNSPLTKEQREAMKAAMKSAVAARKAEANAAKTDKKKIAVLMEAVFGIK